VSGGGGGGGGGGGDAFLLKYIKSAKLPPLILHQCLYFSSHVFGA